MNKILLHLASLLIINTTIAQQIPLSWINKADALGASIQPEKLITDQYRNIYVTGNFGAEAYFDNITLSAITPPNTDIFIAKYDSNGTLIWAKSFGSTGSDYSFSICTDINQEIYISGKFNSDSINFNNHTIYKKQNNYTGFFAKFDTSGMCVFAKSMECRSGLPILSFNSVEDIITDLNGNIIITGGFRADTLMFDSQFLCLQKPSNQLSGSNVFIAKFNSSGNCIWLKGSEPGTIPGGNDTGISLCTDGTGDIYLAGKFGGIKTVWGGKTLQVFDIYEGFCSALDNVTGNVKWTRVIRGFSPLSNTYDDVSDIISDGQGSIYIGGNYIGEEINFDSLNVISSPINPQSQKFFIYKITSNNGLPIWGNIYGQSTNGSAVFENLSLSPINNRLSIAGTYAGTVNFGNLNFPVATAGSFGFLIEMDTSSTLVNGLSMTGTNQNIFTDLKYNLNGNIISIGKYSGLSAQIGNQFSVQNNIAPNQFYSAVIIQSGQNLQNIFNSFSVDQLSLYPNPTTNFITINSNKVGLIILKDIFGNIVYRELKSDSNYALDMRNYSNGIYFLTFICDGKIQTHKIIKL
jgi:hypothetical protein